MTRRSFLTPRRQERQGSSRINVSKILIVLDLLDMKEQKKILFCLASFAPLRDNLLAKLRKLQEALTWGDRWLSAALRERAGDLTGSIS